MKKYILDLKVREKFGGSSNVPIDNAESFAISVLFAIFIMFK